MNADFSTKISGTLWDTHSTLSLFAQHTHDFVCCFDSLTSSGNRGKMSPVKKYAPHTAHAGFACEWCQHPPTSTWKTFCNVKKFDNAGGTFGQVLSFSIEQLLFFILAQVSWCAGGPSTGHRHCLIGGDEGCQSKDHGVWCVFGTTSTRPITDALSPSDWNANLGVKEWDWRFDSLVATEMWKWIDCNLMDEVEDRRLLEPAASKRCHSSLGRHLVLLSGWCGMRPVSECSHCQCDTEEDRMQSDRRCGGGHDGIRCM